MRDAAQSCEMFKRLIQTPDLPDLGPQPRPGRLPLAELNRAVSGFLQETRPALHLEPLIAAAALLWHDHLDESHALSQNIQSPEGSFLHAIMHRREPDFPNAKYWYHRVGNHPCFALIAAAVGPLLSGKPDMELGPRLLPRGAWDPFAFVDACQAAAQRPPGDAPAPTLRAIQQLEFDALVRHIFTRA